MALKVNTVVQVNSFSKHFIGIIVEVKKGFLDTPDKPVYKVEHIDHGGFYTLASCYVKKFTQEMYAEYKKQKIEELNKHLNSIAERL